MDKVIELGEHSIIGTAAEQGLRPIELARIPATENGEPVYVREIFADISHTEIDMSNGGQAVTPIQLHNMLAAFTISDGKKPWGPDKLTGSQLAALFKLITGKQIPWQVGSEGDATVADTETDEVRRIAVRFPYWAFGGKDTDLMPPAVAIRKGQIQVRWAAFPTNMTKDLATVKYYAHITTENELRAVPRLYVSADPLSSLKSILPFYGTLRALILENAGDWAAADMTRMDLKSDRGMLRENVAPLSTNFVPFQNPEVTSARIQRDFCEPLGGTEPRFVMVHPFEPGERVKLSKLPTSTSFKLEITGTEDPANIQALAALVEKMDDRNIVDQLAPAGCDHRQEIEKAINAGGRDSIGSDKTESKTGLNRGDLKGLLPFKLRDERLAKLAGLRL